MNTNDFGSSPRKGHSGKTLRRAIQGLTGLACAVATVFALAQADSSRLGANVSVPNGYLNVQVDDMRGMSTAGLARWSRRWDGKEWKFNAHWESLSQSWTNLTGSVTDGGGSAALGPGIQSSQAVLSANSESGCWVMVDEDWQPSKGSVLVDNTPIGMSMLPERTAPFNKVMGDDAGNYPPPRIVSIDYASLCKGITMSASPVRDVEALRLKNELYLGDNGRYAFSNRAVLEKRAVRMLPPAAAATLDQQLGTGKFTAAPVSLDKGFRWLDKGGDWIDYNTQGQVIAYGDRNNNTVWLVRDTNGFLRGVVDANGHVMFTLHYTNGLIAEVRDYPIPGMTGDLPARSVKYQYDAANRLIAVVDVRGNTVRYGYDTANHLVSITDQEGHVEKYAYAGASVSKRTAPDGGVTDYVFEYDDVNKQFTSRITGPQTSAGRRVEEFTHNRSGQLVRRIVNGRVDEEVRYDTGARTETHKNARGFTNSIVRNEFDQIVQFQQEDGGIIKYSYSAINLVPVEITDQAGVKTQYQYDTVGNLVKKIEAVSAPEERVVEYVLNKQGRAQSILEKGRTEGNSTVTADAVTAIDYDELGQMRQITDPEGKRWGYVYNRLGDLVSITDPKGNVSTNLFDPAGNVIKATDALGGARLFAYDKTGHLLSYTNEKGNETKLVYDSIGRLISSVSPVQGVTTIEYDLNGSTASITNPDGRKMKLEYDNFLRLVKRIDGAGNEIQYDYQISDGSANGLLGSLSAPTLAIYPTYRELNRFDQMERVVFKTLTDPGRSDRTGSVTYDIRGLITGETDAYGKTRTYAYDKLQRPVLITDALGQRTTFQYDARGNLLQVIDAKNNVRRFEYNRNNRVIKEFLPLGKSFESGYDDAGNVVSKVFPNGAHQAYDYDPVNRPVQIKRYNAADVLEGTVNNVWNEVGQLASWTYKEGVYDSSAKISYDGNGRKTAEAVIYPGGFTMGYTYSYSASGKKTEIKWPDGTILSYGYSANGEMQSISIPGEGTINVSEFLWTAPSRVTLPGGGIVTKKYDGLLNLTSYELKTSSQAVTMSLGASYGKNQETKQVSFADAVFGNYITDTFAYDDEMRLTRFVTEGGTYGVRTKTYELDAVANRVAESGVNGPWVYDENNRLKKIGTDDAVVSFDYDANGNRTRKYGPAGQRTDYVYNSENRLVQVRNGAGQLISRYGYDPLGRRIWKEQFRGRDDKTLDVAERTYFLYADEGLIAEATQPILLNADETITLTGIAKIKTQYGLRPGSEFSTGALFVKTKNSNGVDTIAYYHHDQRGAPLEATDRSGKVVWAARYDAFGGAQIITPLASTENPTIVSNLRLPGQVEDIETGLHYNYMRDYDPSTGTYIESDPAGLAGGVNPYLYAAANPLDFQDPLGLWASQKGAYVHQRAGYLVFGDQITQDQLGIVAHGHEWADGPDHQTEEYTFMHAMRRPGQSPADACKQANDYLHMVAEGVMAAQSAGDRDKALFLFAVALHTIQDETSPSHHGFQEWSNHPGKRAVTKHVVKELVYPGKGSSLDMATRRAWDGFNRRDPSAFQLDCSCY